MKKLDCGNMKNTKKAFTMAEALLTMVILGVIAAILIANLKPVKYRDEGFKVTVKKVYAELDDVVNTILVSCSSGMTLANVYNDCAAKDGTATHVFGSQASDATLLKEYIRDVGDCDSALPTGYVANSKFKLKNGTCVALKSNTIWIDVNDKQGPNAANLDQMTLTVGNEGITTAPPEN